MNITATLFAQAAVFALFVAFTGSPAARVDSELGPIPPEFSVMRLGQLVALDKGLSYRGRLLGDVGRPLLGLGEFAARTVTAPRRYTGRHLDRHLVDPGDLLLADEWHLSGTHYARTAEAWYANLMAAREPVHTLFAATYGAGEAERRFQRWRVFFLACAELFGYGDGREWLVAHYRFRPR